MTSKRSKNVKSDEPGKGISIIILFLAMLQLASSYYNLTRTDISEEFGDFVPCKLKLITYIWGLICRVAAIQAVIIDHKYPSFFAITISVLHAGVNFYIWIFRCIQWIYFHHFKDDQQFIMGSYYNQTLTDWSKLFVCVC